MERAVELHFPEDHPVGPGHFPANPIMPGALLLDAAIEAILEQIAPDGGEIVIRSAKFFRPVRPGERLTLQWRPAPTGAIGFECRVGGEERAAFGGTLEIGAQNG